MVTLSCKYSKSVSVNLDMESKIMQEQYKNTKDGQLHYEVTITYTNSRTSVAFDPKHNLKLMPR